MKSTIVIILLAVCLTFSAIESMRIVDSASIHGISEASLGAAAIGKTGTERTSGHARHCLHDHFADASIARNILSLDPHRLASSPSHQHPAGTLEGLVPFPALKPPIAA